VANGTRGVFDTIFGGGSNSYGSRSTTSIEGAIAGSKLTVPTNNAPLDITSISRNLVDGLFQLRADDRAYELNLLRAKGELELAGNRAVLDAQQRSSQNLRELLTISQIEKIRANQAVQQAESKTPFNIGLGGGIAFAVLGVALIFALPKLIGGK